MWLQAQQQHQECSAYPQELLAKLPQHLPGMHMDAELKHSQSPHKGLSNFACMFSWSLFCYIFMCFLKQWTAAVKFAVCVWFPKKNTEVPIFEKNMCSNHGLLRMIFNIGTWVFFNEVSTVCQRGSWSIFWSSGNDMPLVSDRRLRLQPTTALFDISPSMAARSTTAAAPRVRSPQDQTLEGKRELIWVWAKKTR